MFEIFREEYSVEMKPYPKDDRWISIRKCDRDELVVTADTLMAHLSSFRAVLSQKQAAKFTKKDVNLREKIGEIYEHDRPTIFPLLSEPEPKYVVESNY
jgi:hypothetical protein